jgi:hypothetical protein
VATCPLFQAIVTASQLVSVINAFMFDGATKDPMQQAGGSMRHATLRRAKSRVTVIPDGFVWQDRSYPSAGIASILRPAVFVSDIPADDVAGLR